MHVKKIPLADTRAFSPFFLDYIAQKETLKPFYHRFPDVENFKDQITDKSRTFTSHQREVLVKTLNKQYATIDQKEAVAHNISALLNDRTFTITTGHQLNIFTGPLYFIYKIITVINACKELKVKYPEYNFLPVYWMASEDHDYDEIKYFRLYGKKYVWETDQKGAVGRFSTKGLDNLAREIPGDTQVFQDAYQKRATLSDAVRHYVHELFGSEGLIVIDPDDHDLKSLLKPVIEADVLKGVTLPLVDKTNAALEKLNYKTQVFCRDINFFYLDHQRRSRIEKKDGLFKVLDTDLTFTETEMSAMIDQAPEKFSPNVILRPLYQEIILPNLSYVGGPAEVIYWLQLKTVFDHFQTPFPMLMPRNFAMVMDAPLFRKFEKTGLDLQQIFEEKNYLFNHWTLKYSKHNLTVGKERTTVNEIFTELKARAGSIDKTLMPFVGAEGKRALDSLEKIEKKLLRAEKRLQSDKLRQIAEVKDSLFPSGSLQERTDNFLNFYQQDSGFIIKMLRYLEPFDFRFNLLIYTS
jgi:bacillithiol biosynthesis cysteine-adding enzyme BshC